MSENLMRFLVDNRIDEYRASAAALANQFNAQSGACPMARTPTMEMAQSVVDSQRYFQSENMMILRSVAGGMTGAQTASIDNANPVADYLRNNCGITPGGMKR